MFTPPTPSHHCHHIAHAVLHLYHICLVVLGRAYRHAAPVGASEATTVDPRTSRPLGGATKRAVAHSRCMVCDGGEEAIVAAVGGQLGMGLGEEPLELG